MTLSRRALLARLAAGAGTAALPVPTWADAGSPAFVAAAKERSGDYALYGLTGAADIAFRVPLPGRGHAAAAHPERAEAVAFARRPGTFALVLDCAGGRVLHRLESPEGRHFYGHGAFLDGGRVLATTENLFATGEGRIAFWDAANGYRRMGDAPSGGIGPHELLRLPGTEVLAVANGGIRTHPASERETLNIDTMRPNLSYVADGRVVEQVELPPELRLNSIRHLAARGDGTVAMALQWQGDETDLVPLLALHRRGAPLRLRQAADADQAPLLAYAGSVAFAGDGRRVAITGPKGSAAHVFDVDSEAPPEIVRRPDICGAAPCAGGLAFSDGTGGLVTPLGARKHGVAWDNHLVAL